MKGLDEARGDVDLTTPGGKLAVVAHALELGEFELQKRLLGEGRRRRERRGGRRRGDHNGR